jgi:hypothetical protein
LQIKYIEIGSFLNESSSNIHKCWVVISMSDCAGCVSMQSDLQILKNFNIDHPIYNFKISKIGPEEERLLKFCNAGQFPFLCIVENGSVKRRWAGYFVDEEESFRIEQLKSIFSSE